MEGSQQPPPPPPPTSTEACKGQGFTPAYATLKFDDNGSSRIHDVSDGDKEIVTNERYMVMPWKVVTRHGKNMSLREAVDGIFSC